MNVIYILTSLIILSFPVSLIGDSTQVLKRKLESSISGSAVNLSNWNGESLENIFASIFIDYYRSATGFEMESVIKGKAELGYTWIPDSLVKKHLDQLSVQYFLKKSGKKLSRSVNAGLFSRLLTGYNYETDAVQQRLKRKWNGTFFNPSALEVGYGMSMNFWCYSHFNLSLASARLRLEPAVESFKKPGYGIVGRTTRGWVLFDCGLSGQLLVNKAFSQSLEWNGTGKVFLKGIQKEKISFDFSNTMRYRFRKYASLTADLKCVYDPMQSLRLQHRNELLLGLIFISEK